MTPRFKNTAIDGLKIDTRSGVFYFRDTVHISPTKSVWVDKSLKTTSITVAKERAKDIQRKLIRGEETIEDLKRVRHTFDDAFDLVIKMQSSPEKDKDTLDQSKSIIENHLRPWFRENWPFFGEWVRAGKVVSFETHFEEVWADYKTQASGRKLPKHLIGADEEHIAEWKKKNSKPRNLQHDRRYLIMALIRAEKRGWIKKHFDKSDFELKVTSEPIGKYIPDAQVQAILNAAKKYPAVFLQVLMAVIMGMRISEILHVSKEEISLERREIDLDPKRVKTRRRREVPIPIPDEIFPLLKAAVEASQGRFVFPAKFWSVAGQPVNWDKPTDDNSYHWDLIRETAGVDCRFHDLRHTAITNMLIAGMAETAIRKICGVSEETMRRIYAHIEDQLKAKFRILFTGKFQLKEGAI